MHKQSTAILAASLLLVIACSEEKENLQGDNGNPHLSFDGRLIAIESVYCSKRMGRVTLRFAVRSIVLYDPDRFPDATAKMMEVRADCPK